jgi:chemotaxis protein methyltransferase CheR
LVNRYSNYLSLGSHLLIGHSESLHIIETDFDLIGNTVYRKVK